MASSAQQKDEPENFHDILGPLLGPNWNLSVNGGPSTYGRFLLQTVGGGQAELVNEGGFNAGVAAGVDVLLHTGFRLSYAFSSGDLAYRTDNGDGSSVLDATKQGTLESHVLAGEIVRYMLPARAQITPYGGVGFLGAWWKLEDPSALIEPAGGATQFRFGALVTIGIQFVLMDHLSARLEVAQSSAGNPFTGNHSYRGLAGSTIDEPTSVGKTDYRLGVVYYFRGPERPRRVGATNCPEPRNRGKGKRPSSHTGC